MPAPNTARQMSEENLNFVSSVRRKHSMSYRELARLSEYSEEYVRSWFAANGSSKYRPVPDRAVTIIKLKLKQEGPLV